MTWLRGILLASAVVAQTASVSSSRQEQPILLEEGDFVAKSELPREIPPDQDHPLARKLIAADEGEISCEPTPQKILTITSWKIGPAHTMAEFRVKHMMITNVKGQFSGVSGTLSFDEQDVTNSKIDVTIPTATINTREPDRDTHLKSADFFDVEKFPTISFKSTSVTRRPNDELEVEGDLTIHGVTRWWVMMLRSPSTLNL
jgi:hypothetical protein